MANQVQNLAQFSITSLKGSPTKGPQNTLPVLFNPASGTNPLKACSPLKIVSQATSKQILVDLAGAGDTAIAFVPFQEKKQTYVPGENIEAFFEGSLLWLEAAATINAGDLVIASATSASDGSPGVTTVTTATRVDGQALTGGTVGQLVLIRVKPGLHP